MWGNDFHAFKIYAKKAIMHLEVVEFSVEVYTKKRFCYNITPVD